MARAKAKVTLTVEVTVSSAWGDDCTVKQVYDQGVEEAKATMRGALRGTGAVMVGEPSVKSIYTEE